MHRDLVDHYKNQLELIAQARGQVESGVSPSVPHALIALAHAAAPAGSPEPNAGELLELYRLAYGEEVDLTEMLLESRTPCQRGQTPLELLREGSWLLLRHCVGSLAGGASA